MIGYKKKGRRNTPCLISQNKSKGKRKIEDAWHEVGPLTAKVLLARFHH